MIGGDGGSGDSSDVESDGGSDGGGGCGGGGGGGDDSIGSGGARWPWRRWWQELVGGSGACNNSRIFANSEAHAFLSSQ